MTRERNVWIEIAVVAVLLGVWGDLLFGGATLGLNVGLFATAFVLGLAVLLRISRAPMHQGRRWMAAPLLLFSLAFGWHASPLLTAANLLAIASAVALGALRRTEPNVHRAGVGDYAAGLAAAGASAFAGGFHLFRSDIEWERLGRRARGERAASVARGIALGLPMVVLFGGLFVAADVVFEHLVWAAVPTFSHPFQHTVLFVAGAWLTAGLLRDLLMPREEQRLFSPAAAVAQTRPIRLGGTELGIMLGALDLLFLAFVLVQLRYLFGGRGLVEAQAGLTYAQYARHGFFELVAVSALVLLVLLFAGSAVRADRPRDVRIVRILSAVLIALVGVVMVSALQRMRLYEQQYGLTELRIWTTGVILWLGIVFIWFAATALRGKRHLFAIGALVSGFVFTAGLNVVNPDSLIARTNLSRPHLDAHYVGTLSDDAVPVLLDRLPTLRPDLRRALAIELLHRGSGPGGWQSFNLARSRADSLLAEHRAELLRFAGPGS